MNEKNIFTLKNNIENGNSIECSSGHKIFKDGKENIHVTPGEPLTFWVNEDGSNAGIPKNTWVLPWFAFGYHDEYNIHIKKILGESVPMWELLIEKTGSASQNSIRSTANVTVGDGEPPKILGEEE
jgi:hypothetical protein